MFVPWIEIDALATVRKTLTYLSLLETNPQPIPKSLVYKSKIKLDGTNSAVNLHEHKVEYQSRNRTITPDDDNFGFARWAHSHFDYWQKLTSDFPFETPVTIHGEWAGQGVIGGTAIAQSPRIFAIFAIQIGDQVIVEPSRISNLLKALPANTYILPWHSEIEIPFIDEEALATAVRILNEEILKIEVEDPWVKKIMGISGVGEGLVLYPPADKNLGINVNDLKNLIFKAKGTLHRVKAAPTAVEANPTVLAGIQAFVDTYVTIPRCTQGLRVACNNDPDVKNTGAFLKWLILDVQKESATDIAANNLDWKTLVGPVQNAGRVWFKSASF